MVTFIGMKCVSNSVEQRFKTAWCSATDFHSSTSVFMRFQTGDQDIKHQLHSLSSSYPVSPGQKNEAKKRPLEVIIFLGRRTEPASDLLRLCREKNVSLSSNPQTNKQQCRKIFLGTLLVNDRCKCDYLKRDIFFLICSFTVPLENQ